MTKTSPALCEQCKINPVRKYANAGTRMSKFCSNECGAAAKKAKAREMAKEPGWGTDKYGRRSAVAASHIKAPSIYNDWSHEPVELDSIQHNPFL